MPISWITAAAAVCFFVYAVLASRQAGTSPPSVNTLHGRPAGFARPPRSHPEFGRYARVAAGRIFFGEPAVVIDNEPQPIYLSGLTLRGISRGGGQTPQAVLARAGTSPEGESWTVKPGETVLGETVVAIETVSVVLRKGGLETVLVLPN